MTAADRLPGGPGARRRRPDGRRRSRSSATSSRPASAASTKASSARVFGVSTVARPAARRLLRRQPVLALDLLHQPPDRGRGARRDRGRVPARPTGTPPLDRLPRRSAAGGEPRADRALHEPRRHDLPLEVAGDGRADRRWLPCCSLRSSSRSTAPPSRFCRSSSSATGSSLSQARSGSSSAWRSSARSPTCRSTSRTSRATARRPRAC